MTKKHQLKYIVLSDLHLGEADSIFSVENGEKPAFLDLFSKCLKDLIFHFNEENELPKLIFNGDILGLAFSTYSQSLEAFEHFVASLTLHHKICDNVIYIPGNHDHQIWNLAMEDDYKLRLSNSKKGEEVPELIAATSPIYKDGLPSSFLKAFMKRIGAVDTTLKVFYPNFLLPAPTADSPFVLFHHGHFSEDTYHAITKMMQSLYPELKDPDTLEMLEHQNGAWINFAFSQLGRSGEAGNFFEQLMSTLSSEEKLNNNKDELAENIAKSFDFPYLPFDWMEKLLSKQLLNNIAEHVQTERYSGSTTCSDETLENLMHYFNTYCLKTLKESGWSKNNLHFVWSHTHKPFELNTKSEIFGDLKITNTGGWTVPPQESPKHGASIVLINEKNEVQSLRVFMDTKEKDKAVLKVTMPDNEEMTDFGKQIEANIYNENGQLTQSWADFKDELEAIIKKRRAE